ncbi:MAG: baseplate J/gp47 family protein [Eubacterium sp.]
MNLTYEEILSSMKQAYYDKCGELADTGSEMGKRLEVVASELFSLSCHIDYVFKQAFVQTATGESLDLHGNIRGCTRKSASEAQGYLKFYINEALEEDLIIPQSTVCSVYQKPYLQYSTTEEAVIPAGETSVKVLAVSLGKSDEYNAQSDTITVMVNAPIGVSGVTNEKFTGGFSGETESAYRQRIIDRYTILQNGLNAQSLENAITDAENITDCYIGYNEKNNMVEIIVTTKNGEISNEDFLVITKTTSLVDIFGITRALTIAKEQLFSITADINIRTGFDIEKTKQEFTQRLTDICSAQRIGKNLSLNKITKELFDIDGLSDINLYSENALGGIIYCDSDKYLKLESLAVNYFAD